MGSMQGWVDEGGQGLLPEHWRQKYVSSLSMATFLSLSPCRGTGLQCTWPVHLSPCPREPQPGRSAGQGAPKSGPALLPPPPRGWGSPSCSRPKPHHYSQEPHSISDRSFSFILSFLIPSFYPFCFLFVFYLFCFDFGL